MKIQLFLIVALIMTLTKVSGQRTMAMSIDRKPLLSTATTQHYSLTATATDDFSTGAYRSWTLGSITLRFPSWVPTNDGSPKILLTRTAPNATGSSYFSGISSAFTALAFNDNYSGTAVANGLNFYDLPYEGGAADGYMYVTITSGSANNQPIVQGTTVSVLEFDIPSNWGLGNTCPDSSCITIVTSEPTGANAITTNIAAILTNSGVNSGNTNVLTFTQVSAPLPITLLSFDAAKAGATVKLNWSVSSEVNAKGYDVERSGNGTSFTKIGFVAATGSSNYTNTDASPLSGVNYYRLKMVDIDGKFKYSNVRTVLFDGTAVLFDIYPNPVVTSKLYLHLQQNKYAGQAQAIITDIAGRSIQSTNINVVKGNIQLPITVKGLSTGTYFITIYDASGVAITETKKLVKQ